MTRLHPDTIEAVKQRMDIYDVVSEHVVLRKQGKDFAGLCPFHEEKTPSFTVSPSKQLFYCFGCGKGGNAISFLMEIGQQSFADVVLNLAQRYQVPVRTLDEREQQDFQRQLSRREQLYEILAIACSFYEHALRQPQGKTALDYLKQSRHLSDDTIRKFQLGYAPEGWETLYGYLVKQKGYPTELVEAAGLIVARKNGSGYYDRFRNRVLIPICDDRGRVIGFGGRTLTDEQPKYLNSPETELFDKGRTLFSIDKARQAIAKFDRAVVVEGYFDVIALHAAGISEVVASLGTALGEVQVKHLLRYTESKQVILNFDTDAAGNRAAQRAIGEVADLAYRGMVQLRVLQIPEGKDADEFLQSASPEAYRKLIDESPLWIDWQIDEIAGDRDLSRADLYQTTVRELVKLLDRIQNRTTRTHYINQCAQKLSQGDARRVPLLEENLIARLRRSVSRRAVKRDESSEVESHDEDLPLPVDADRSLLERAEALLLRVYLHDVDARSIVLDAVQALEEQDISFSVSHYYWLWQHLTELAPTPRDSAASLWGKLQERYSEASAMLKRIEVLFQAGEMEEIDVRRAPLVVRSAASAIERTIAQKRYRQILQSLETIDIREEPELARQYQTQLLAEKRHIDELDRRRNIDLTDLVSLPWQAPSPQLEAAEGSIDV
ncbi:MAG: DNA primase [Cyanobacteria bacterium SID2]|nr:DNA primase [Cyanobacteria bacterium SID2]